MRTQYIIPKGRDKVYIISLTTGAFVSLLLNLVLIPKYSGIGAVIGTLGAELSVCLVQFALIRREIPFGVYLKMD